jgi:hypothetical protein
MQHKTLGLICSVGVFSLVSATAQAQNTAGALQLALGTDVITYSSASLKTKGLPAGGAALYDYTQDRSTVRWGFSNRSAINLEGGYGLGDSLVLGGIVALGGGSEKDGPEPPNRPNNTDQTKFSTFDLLIAPKIDYMFLPGQSIRPFIGGALGLRYFSETRQNIPATNVTQTQYDVSATGLALLARAGVRFFLTPGFSLDPAFTFLWTPVASGSTQILATSYDASAHSYTLGLTLAASGWVGL